MSDAASDEIVAKRLASVLAEEPVLTPPGLHDHLSRIQEILLEHEPPESSHDYLLLLRIDAAPQWVALDRKLLIIGRQDDCDLCLDACGISRQHCQLTYDDEDWRIVDLDSKNGLRINGKPSTQRYLCHGDAIQIGSILAIFCLSDK